MVRTVDDAIKIPKFHCHYVRYGVVLKAQVGTATSDAAAAAVGDNGVPLDQCLVDATSLWDNGWPL